MAHKTIAFSCDWSSFSDKRADKAKRTRTRVGEAKGCRRVGWSESLLAISGGGVPWQRSRVRHALAERACGGISFAVVRRPSACGGAALTGDLAMAATATRRPIGWRDREADVDVRPHPATERAARLLAVDQR